MLEIVDIEPVVRAKKRIHSGALAAMLIGFFPPTLTSPLIFYCSHRMRQGSLRAAYVNLLLVGMTALFWCYIGVQYPEEFSDVKNPREPLFLRILFPVLMFGLPWLPAILVLRGIRGLRWIQESQSRLSLFPPNRPTGGFFRWRPRLRTVAWVGAGCALSAGLIGAEVVAYVIGFNLTEGRLEALLAISTPAAFYWTVRKLRQIQRWTLSRRALSAPEARIVDSRRPVLFLRSFTDDDVRLEPIGKINFWTIFDAHKSERGYDLTLEEGLASTLAEWGPVIALANPKRPVASLGAARENVADDWPEVVERYLDEALWIVAIVGRSQGFLWEVDRVLEKGLADKLVLVFPPVEEERIRSRWADLVTHLAPFIDERDRKHGRVDDALAARFEQNASRLILMVGGKRDQLHLDTALRVALT